MTCELAEWRDYDILLLLILTSILIQNGWAAGLILGQIRYCTKQNSSQLPAICLGRDGQFWNWLEHKMNMKGRIAVYKQFTRWRPRQKTLLWMSVILGSFNPLSPDISNGNRTEWSPIRSVIIWVINKIGWSHSKSPICLTMSMITDRIGWHKVLLPTNNNYIKIGDTLGYF